MEFFPGPCIPFFLRAKIGYRCLKNNPKFGKSVVTLLGPEAPPLQGKCLFPPYLPSTPPLWDIPRVELKQLTARQESSSFISGHTWTSGMLTLGQDKGNEIYNALFKISYHKKEMVII